MGEGLVARGSCPARAQGGNARYGQWGLVEQRQQALGLHRRHGCDVDHRRLQTCHQRRGLCMGWIGPPARSRCHAVVRGTTSGSRPVVWKRTVTGAAP